MNEPINTYELIEKYCLDLMDERERHYFEVEIEKNPALANAVKEHQVLLLSFDHLQSSNFIKSELRTIHTHSRSHTEVMMSQLKLHVSRYWKTASVAASVAFLASILTFVGARSIYNKDNAGVYVKLKGVEGDINRIKKEQKAIKNDLSHVKKNVVPVPEGPSKYTGTSFALSQDGYMVTNLHVIDGYNKIFIFTNDGVGHQSEVVATDLENDLAILKITETDFKFSQKVPYSVRKANPNIAQRVYSLGYPKADVVYNEGYISSITGFQGDSNRYQLELPSGPGVSGAPIIDETGNVIGIISGKQSQSEGITFAIKSKSLMNLFKSLPKEFSSNEIAVNNIKGDSRSNQVKKIKPFVCEVKVYN